MKVGDVYKYVDGIGRVYRLEIVTISKELNDIYGQEVVEVMIESGIELILTPDIIENDCEFDDESPNVKEK